MYDDTAPDSSCSRGSGKKNRSCSPRENNQTPAPAANRKRPVVSGDMEECDRLHHKGLVYMQRGQFKQAISWFTKALAVDKSICNPANNLALSLFLMGKTEEAICVQRQSFADCPLPNPFGLANLSLFLLFLGDEQGADEAASLAAQQQALNAEATIKVCEMLARLRRHRDILATADASDFGSEPYVLFYTGVAAANLGNRDRALADLSRVPIGFVKAKLAQTSLQHLKNNTQPNTVRQDWPYLLPEEFYVSCLFTGDDAAILSLVSRRYVVDFAETLLNDNPDDPGIAMSMLEVCEHPEAVAVLRLIMKGSFGSDQLRCQAASLLAEKGEIKPGEEFEMFHHGQCGIEKIFSIHLNPEFTYGEMPPSVGKRYHKLVLASHKPFADWQKIGAGYQKLAQEAPDYYPLRYNYAVSLYKCHRIQETESILRSLVAEYPAYLFARAALLSLLVHTKRLEEAEQLANQTDFPKETHPDAYVAWLTSKMAYCEAIGQDAEAFSIIKTAQEIAPENPHVALLWSKWRNYKEKKAPAAGRAAKRKNKK
ncbi:MAG: tetratricopeptide repeat protein [Oligosphaeraceae bacterium]|nr:tetratricopeptide repeat protein [Oligosphaeraceae bacterium]